MPNHLLLPVMVDVIVTVIVFIMLSTPKAQKLPDKICYTGIIFGVWASAVFK